MHTQTNDMSLDAIMAAVEFRLHTNDGATWHILNSDSEIMFSADEAAAVREFESNYLTAEQLTALQMDLEIDNAIQAEDAANHRLGYTA